MKSSGDDDPAASRGTTAPVSTPAASATESAQAGKTTAPATQQLQPPRHGAADADTDARTAAEAPRRAPRREWIESLSDAQRASMKALREQTSERTNAMRDAQRQQQQVFHEALVTGDREAALAASGELVELAAQGERLRLEELVKMSELLTPEQREQMPSQVRGGGRMRQWEGRGGAGRRGERRQMPAGD